ncbi:hypothetical protein M3Y99_00710900 [Aphelenchoides fujianensis]|nr:hypothetical protein M3Y99_00710900 [Aphelenchoides fujianensis]
MRTSLLLVAGLLLVCAFVSVKAEKHIKCYACSGDDCTKWKNGEQSQQQCTGDYSCVKVLDGDKKVSYKRCYIDDKGNFAKGTKGCKTENGQTTCICNGNLCNAGVSFSGSGLMVSLSAVGLLLFAHPMR